MKAFIYAIAASCLAPFAFGDVGTSRQCESPEIVDDVWLRVDARNTEIEDPYTEDDLASGIFEFYAKIRNFIDTEETFAAVKYDYNDGDYMIFNLRMYEGHDIGAFDDSDWFALTACLENDLHKENDPFTAKFEICLDDNGSNCIGFMSISAFVFADE